MFPSFILFIIKNKLGQYFIEKIKMAKKIYNFTNIASHYRSLLWEKLISNSDFEFHFFYGQNKSLQIKEINFTKAEFKEQTHKLHKLNNFWLKDKMLIWQSGVINRCLVDKIDIAIFLGEFQIISTWIAMLICRLRGIKVVYWTHGLYGNESTLKKKLRVLFYKTANEILLYERRSKKLLIDENINADSLKVIFNSLDYDAHKSLRNKKEITNNYIPAFFKNNNLPYLIFVGRLTKVKKIDLLIQALEQINNTAKKVNLLLVGDGVEKETLYNYVVENNLQNFVHFYGACYNEETLAKLIYHANLCVSPGNVGLTAIHALSFGTPVCTHSNFFNQMPEVEVVKEGETGCFFKEKNIQSLTEVIINWLNRSKERKLTRIKCYKIIDTYYNPYYQQKIINSL